jgi:hypothetical protein
MKLGSIFLRGGPFVLMFALLLAAPGKAQTLDSSVTADYLGPGSQTILNDNSDQSTKEFTVDRRLEWFLDSTMGSGSLVAGAVSAGLGTGLNSPGERGDIGQSFFRRYEMHLAETSTENGMEAALGAIWGEDPRYFRVQTESFGKRLKNVIRMTFVAYRSDGDLAPAYARYIGITGSSFLANSWEANGAANIDGVALRALTGFLGRMGGNAFQEFWPSVKPHLLRHLPSMQP